MKNSFHLALRTGRHEVLLLTPVLGLAVLGVCLVTTQLPDRPPVPDADQGRLVAQMDAMARNLADIQARLEAEPPLAGIKERGQPAPPPAAPEPPALSEPPAAEDDAVAEAGVFPDPDDPDAVLDPDAAPPPPPWS